MGEDNKTNNDVVTKSSSSSRTMPMFENRINFGQGKTATTILDSEGYHYPVIHEPYSHTAYYGQQRNTSAPARIKRGDRPMHKTTMTVAKPPWESDYTTTSNQYFSGSTVLEPVRRPPKCRSMHISQIRLGSQEDSNHFTSDHMNTYYKKEIIPANRLHLSSLVNRVNQSEGVKMKEVVKPVNEPPSYWSQYNRIHNKLGALRGPGVGREYPVRQQYDIFTGEHCGAAWQPNNTKVSGNRVLHGKRTLLESRQLLF